MSNSTSPSSASPAPPSPADTASLRRSWHRGLTPLPNLDVVQWAERFRKLSKESSNGGRFFVSRVEVAREPMLRATEPGVSKITLMACTQLLKTAPIENVIGRFAHVDPSPLPEATSDSLALIKAALLGVAKTWREPGERP